MIEQLSTMKLYFKIFVWFSVWNAVFVQSFEENVEIVSSDLIKEVFFDSIQERIEGPTLCQMQLAYLRNNYKKLSIFPSEFLNILL